MLPLVLNAGMNTVNCTRKDTIQAVLRVYAVSRDCPPADLLSQLVRPNNMQLAYFRRVTAPLCISKIYPTYSKCYAIYRHLSLAYNNFCTTYNKCYPTYSKFYAFHQHYHLAYSHFYTTHHTFYAAYIKLYAV